MIRRTIIFTFAVYFFELRRDKKGIKITLISANLRLRSFFKKLHQYVKQDKEINGGEWPKYTNLFQEFANFEWL